MRSTILVLYFSACSGATSLDVPDLPGADLSPPSPAADLCPADAAPDLSRPATDSATAPDLDPRPDLARPAPPDLAPQPDLEPCGGDGQRCCNDGVLCDEPSPALRCTSEGTCTSCGLGAAVGTYRQHCCGGDPLTHVGGTCLDGWTCLDSTHLDAGKCG